MKTLCPWVESGVPCFGELSLVYTERTSMGYYQGVNANKVTEAWNCPKCGRTFTRSFQWRRE